MFIELFGKSIGMPLLAVAVLDLHVVSLCTENQFMVQTICCDLCPKGRYASENCTRKGGEYLGVRCLECTKCAEGMEMISPCSSFSNTKCQEMITTTLPTNTTNTMGVPSPKAPFKLTALCIIAPVILTVITAIVCIWCMRRSISHNTKEPFKTII